MSHNASEKLSNSLACQNGTEQYKQNFFYPFNIFQCSIQCENTQKYVCKYVNISYSADEQESVYKYCKSQSEHGDVQIFIYSHKKFTPTSTTSVDITVLRKGKRHGSMGPIY